MDEEPRLLIAVTDPQCAWQMLVKCCVPRPNYVLRKLPPRESLDYARGQDARTCETAVSILCVHGLAAEELVAGLQMAQLLARLGRVGLRSADRTATAAYWSSWADALRMMAARNPTRTRGVIDSLSGVPVGCLAELACAAWG